VPIEEIGVMDEAIKTGVEELLAGVSGASPADNTSRTSQRDLERGVVESPATEAAASG